MQNDVNSFASSFALKYNQDIPKTNEIKIIKKIFVKYK